VNLIYEITEKMNDFMMTKMFLDLNVELSENVSQRRREGFLTSAMLFLTTSLNQFMLF
jgi:uncharacterized membrane-anchored protein